METMTKEVQAVMVVRGQQSVAAQAEYIIASAWANMACTEEYIARLDIHVLTPAATRLMVTINNINNHGK
jgi:hypothetical protein